MFRDISIAPVRGVIDDIREITADSSHPFFSVEIECYVDDPPPPGLKPCPQCGALSNRQFQSRRTIRINMDEFVPNASGRVRLTFVDADERRDVEIPFGLDENRPLGTLG